jgi:hypothetical protein
MQDGINPISDNKEDSSPGKTQLVTLSKRALGELRRRCVSEPEGEVDHDLDDHDGKHPCL